MAETSTRAAIADGVHQPGGLEHEQAHLLDLRTRLGVQR
jgi:hypothetical protein